MKRVRAIAGLLFAIVAGLAVWSFALEPASLTTRHYRLSIPHWHADLAGLRIAVLADLHVGSPFNGIPKLHEIVAITNELKPDLILIPGDFVIQGVIGGGLVTPEDSAAVLATLTAPLGVWACLGNHDWWLDAKRVRSALESQGIPVSESGDPSWGYEAVLDLYRHRIEAWAGSPDPDYRGMRGMVQVQPAAEPSPFSFASLQARHQLSQRHTRSVHYASVFRNLN